MVSSSIVAVRRVLTGDDSLDESSFLWGPLPLFVAFQPASSFSLAPIDVSSSDLVQAPWALEPAPLPNRGILALYDSQSKSFSRHGRLRSKYSEFSHTKLPMKVWHWSSGNTFSRAMWLCLHYRQLKTPQFQPTSPLKWTRLSGMSAHQGASSRFTYRWD